MDVVAVGGGGGGEGLVPCVPLFLVLYFFRLIYRCMTYPLGYLSLYPFLYLPTSIVLIYVHSFVFIRFGARLADWLREEGGGSDG